jgi:hypothetical protein
VIICRHTLENGVVAATAVGEKIAFRDLADILGNRTILAKCIVD